MPTKNEAALIPNKNDAVCKSCHSDNRQAFNGELAMHFPGVDGLKKPIVWAFPKLLVCLDCGCAEFSMAEGELQVLTQVAAA